MAMDFEQYIISKNDKAKWLQTKSAPNWDISLLFKIGRKKHEIKLDNFDYEKLQADINAKEEYSWLMEYHTKLRAAQEEVTKEYADRIKEYNKETWEATDEFMKSGRQDDTKLKLDFLSRWKLHSQFQRNYSF